MNHLPTKESIPSQYLTLFYQGTSSFPMTFRHRLTDTTFASVCPFDARVVFLFMFTHFLVRAWRRSICSSQPWRHLLAQFRWSDHPTPPRQYKWRGRTGTKLAQTHGDGMILILPSCMYGRVPFSYCELTLVTYTVHFKSLAS